MDLFQKHRVIWIIIVAVASLSLIITSFLPYFIGF